MYWWRREGSKKLAEALESTNARTIIGGWWGRRRWTRRDRWQGWGKGRGVRIEREPNPYWLVGWSFFGWYASGLKVVWGEGRDI